MQKNRRSRRRGFTLMEVLLVMAILVILGSLVTVSYINIQRARTLRQLRRGSTWSHQLSVYINSIWDGRHHPI
ncbi:MAG: type II secretion system protein [Pirellulales bacterium]